MNFKQQAHSILEKHLSAWESNPNRMESGYDFEATFAQTMKDFEHELFQLSVEEVPTDKNRKKNSKPDLEASN